MIGLLRTETWVLDKGQGHAGKLQNKTPPSEVSSSRSDPHTASPVSQWASQLVLTLGETANQRVKRGPDETGVSAARYKTAAPLRKVDLSSTNSGGLLNTACHSLPPFLQPGAWDRSPRRLCQEALMGPEGI